MNALVFKELFAESGKKKEIMKTRKGVYKIITYLKRNNRTVKSERKKEH
jgi:hypothetical protein